MFICKIKHNLLYILREVLLVIHLDLNQFYSPPDSNSDNTEKLLNTKWANQK